MKESPDIVHLDMVLRSSAMVAGGFMGADDRSVTEVIDTDAGELSRLGVTAAQIAGWMQRITDRAAEALSTWVELDGLRAMVDETRGSLPCPWPHEVYFFKRLTTLEVPGSDGTLRWSDLNIHMVGAHGFFGGRGSLYRLEPVELARLVARH